MTGYVYAIKSGELIKLGWSSDPRRRLWEVRSEIGAEVDLLGYAPGTKHHEQELHEICAAQRVRGEWFTNGGPVALFVGHLQTPNAYADTLFAPIGERHLKKVSDIIRVIGGTKRIAEIFDCGVTTVGNWRVWNALPSNTFLVISGELDRLGVTADLSLWNFAAVRVEEPVQ